MGIERQLDLHNELQRRSVEILLDGNNFIVRFPS